jgi:hypothetical protein
MGFGGRGWNAFFIRRAPNCFGDATGDALNALGEIMTF